RAAGERRGHRPTFALRETSSRRAGSLHHPIGGSAFAVDARFSARVGVLGALRARSVVSRTEIDEAIARERVGSVSARRASEARASDAPAAIRLASLVVLLPHARRVSHRLSLEASPRVHRLRARRARESTVAARSDRKSVGMSASVSESGASRYGGAPLGMSAAETSDSCERYDYRSQ